jgi:hypothetical protein
MGMFCDECNEAILTKTQKKQPYFICYDKKDRYSWFCVFARRDYIRKMESQNNTCDKPRQVAQNPCAKYLDDDFSNQIIETAISLGYIKEITRGEDEL